MAGYKHVAPLGQRSSIPEQSYGGSKKTRRTERKRREKLRLGHHWMGVVL